MQHARNIFPQNLEMWAKLQDSTKMDLNQIRDNNVAWYLLESGSNEFSGCIGSGRFFVQGTLLSIHTVCVSLKT